MEPSDDSGSTQTGIRARNGAASDSDGSSLVSFGSATVSLIDSHFAERETHVASAEDLIILDAGPAPPDYNQATAYRQLANSQPVDEESLYSASERNASLNRSLHAPVSNGTKRVLRQHWKRLCLLNLVVSCLLTATLLTIGLITSRKALFRQSEAVQLLGIFPPEHPLNNRFHPERFHKNTSQCQFTSYPHDYFFFGWLDPGNFSFEEDLLLPDYQAYHDLDDVSISGNIELRPAPYGESDPINVIISYAWTSAWQAGLPEWQKDSNTESLRIHAPSSLDPLVSQTRAQHIRPVEGVAPGEGNGKACLDIWVGIYVQTQLDNFNLRTENLHLDIGTFASYEKGSFSFRIRNESQIHTRNGNITTNDWDARKATFTSKSGSIKGEFGINDYLHLETEGGDILAQIRQKAAHEKKYLVTHPPGTPANLTTKSGSGKQSISIHQGLNEMVWAERLGYGYPFLLQSSHNSESGAMSIAAGMYWGGRIHATSNNGSINFHGLSVHIEPDPVDNIAHGGTSSDVWAHKGTWDSSMALETEDGDIHVCLEDEDQWWDCRSFLPDLNRFLYPNAPYMWGYEDVKT